MNGAGRTKHDPVIPTYFLCAIAALPGVSILKGTSVSKDQAILPIPVWLLLPCLESQSFCLQTHLQLGTSRHTPSIIWARQTTFSSSDLRILRRKAVFFSGHICTVNICIALLFSRTWTLQSLYFWASWRILIFLLGPLRVFSLPPTPLLPDPEYQQIKLF